MSEILVKQRRTRFRRFVFGGQFKDPYARGIRVAHLRRKRGGR
jgi:hypothetical protein